MSIRSKFCRSVPPEILQSFLLYVLPTLSYVLPTYCARKLFDKNRMRWSAVELEVAHCRSRPRQSALLWAPHHTTCVTTPTYYINHTTLLYRPHHTTIWTTPHYFCGQHPLYLPTIQDFATLLTQNTLLQYLALLGTTLQYLPLLLETTLHCTPSTHPQYFAHWQTINTLPILSTHNTGPLCLTQGCNGHWPKHIVLVSGLRFSPILVLIYSSKLSLNRGYCSVFLGKNLSESVNLHMLVFMGFLTHIFFEDNGDGGVRKWKWKMWVLHQNGITPQRCTGMGSQHKFDITQDFSVSQYRFPFDEHVEKVVLD